VAETMNSIPSQSREELEKLERKHAENPEGRYFVPLANAFRKVGEIDRAMELLRAGLAKHPDYLSAHIVLGRCLSDLGEEEGAAAEFRHVLALDPQNLIALRTLGEISLGAGRRDEARRWFQNLLAVDPMNEEARRALESLASVVETTAASPASGPAEPPTEALVPEQLPATSSPDVEAPGMPADLRGAEPTAPVAEVEPWDEEPDADEDAEAEEFEFGGESEAVVTETIAELYTRQGVYDRAAEVYRELIRQRGPDAGLEQRLQRVEALARGESDQHAEAAEAEGGVQAEAEDEELSHELPFLVGGEDLARGEDSPLAAAGRVEDPFADSFDFGFPGEDPPAPEWDELPPLLPSQAESTAHEPSASEDLPPASTIRSLLRQMLAWTPGSEAAGDGAEIEAPSGAAGGEDEGEHGAASLPLVSTGEPPLPPGEVGGAIDEEMHPLPAPDEHGVLQGWAGAPAGADDDFDRLFGVLDPEPLASEPVAPEGSSGLSPAPFEADEVDDLFPWEMPAAAPPAESLHGKRSGPDPTADQNADPDPDREPEARSGEDREVSGTENGDDDLESFQAWLRSLKR
jgi:tetratricopeptide (TPR) repeat protein